jgi:mono/diheme cytochrome c family protein
MSRHFRLCSSALFLLGVSLTAGCGGSSDAPTPVAQAPVPTTEANAEDALSSNDDSSSNDSANTEEAGGASYSGENYSRNSGGGNSGDMNSGGMNSEDMNSGGMNSEYDDDDSMANSGGNSGGAKSLSSMSSGIPGGMPGASQSSAMPGMSGGTSGTSGMSGMSGMSGGMSGMSGGSGMEIEDLEGGGGFGGGFGGPSSSNSPSFDMLAAFAKQNCLQCHGEANPKGGFSIAALTDDFVADGEAWSEVVTQIKSGAMPPASAQRQIDPAQKGMLISYLEEQLTDTGSSNDAYLVRAKHYFGSGKEKEALKYLYAHTLVADDEAASELLSRSRWFSLGRHPATAVRFAAGVVLTAPATITDLKPIGTTQFANGGGGGDSMGGMMGSSMGGGQRNASTTAERNFYDLTGDVGQALASAFETRWSSGSLGTVFNDVAAEDKNARTIASAGGNGIGYGGGMPGMSGGMSGMAGGMSGGMSGGMGLEDGFGESNFGGGMGMGGGEGAAARKPVKPGQNITPGLVFLGTGSQQELVKKAEEAGVDGIFLFDVEVSQNARNKIVTNETKVRLLVAGEIKAASTSLKNTDVERAAIRGTGGDEVAKSIDKLFARFDTEVQLTDMPDLKPEHAKSRIHQMVNDKDANPMTTLYETRLFNSKGLISQAEMETVFQIVLRGNEGISLASGSSVDRLLVIKDLLKKL